MEGTAEKYLVNNTYNGLHEFICMENAGAGHKEIVLTEYDEMIYKKEENPVTAREESYPKRMPAAMKPFMNTT